jgi:hypothetical protein
MSTPSCRHEDRELSGCSSGGRAWLRRPARRRRRGRRPVRLRTRVARERCRAARPRTPRRSSALRCRDGLPLPWPRPGRCSAPASPGRKLGERRAELRLRHLVDGVRAGVVDLVQLPVEGPVDPSAVRLRDLVPLDERLGGRGRRSRTGARRRSAARAPRARAPANRPAPLRARAVERGARPPSRSRPRSLGRAAARVAPGQRLDPVAPGRLAQAVASDAEQP